jgi:hypothetical protein
MEEDSDLLALEPFGAVRAGVECAGQKPGYTSGRKAKRIEQILRPSRRQLPNSLPSPGATGE